MGFEPTRAEPIGLAVQRLNHSATSSWHKLGEINTNLLPLQFHTLRTMIKLKNKDKPLTKRISHAGS